MWHPALIILLASWMLVGCASLNPQPEERVARTAPVGLMLACLPPEEPIKGDLSEMLEVYVENVQRLHECKARHAALSAWLKADLSFSPSKP